MAALTVDDQPYRRAKPEPMEELYLLLHPQPLVRIIEGDEANAAWNAWADTVADRLSLT